MKKIEVTMDPLDNNLLYNLPYEDIKSKSVQYLMGYRRTLGPFNNLPKIGRNDSCPCGSGKKYKKCCQ